jgi:hypothetical protein
MALKEKIERLKAQILDTERIIELVADHPIMLEGLQEKIQQLRDKLATYPNEIIDGSVRMLFSGNAVHGSEGIKTTFLTKTLKPFTALLKTQAALERFGQIGARGRSRQGVNTDLYLTALPRGSFGVELKQLETEELFDEEEVSNALKDVINLIYQSSISDETFEQAITDVPKRSLNNLKSFLKQIDEHESFLKISCGEIRREISEDNVHLAYERVSSINEESSELIVNGIFKGVLLNSGKFEITNEEGDKISGFISTEIPEETLIEYDRVFLNQECRIHLELTKKTFVTGNEVTVYELLEITASE